MVSATFFLIKDDNLCGEFSLTYQYARLWHLNLCLIPRSSLIYFYLGLLRIQIHKRPYSFLDIILSYNIKTKVLILISSFFLIFLSFKENKKIIF